MSESLARFITRHKRRLEAAGIDHAANEIEIILGHLLEVDRMHLYLDGLESFDENAEAQFEAIMERRLTREPLQYILREGWFYGRTFLVTPAVMAPTPETETLCETAMGYLKESGISTPRILDVGVGSGVIAVTLANEIPDSTVVALDISPDALEIARHNAAELGGFERMSFRQSDMFAAVEPDERFEIIISNPPYIAEPDYADLPPEVKADPKIAMTAGPEGMDIIARLIDAAPDFLAERGRLLFEVGWDQAEKVAALTDNDPRYTSLNIYKDLNDIERIIMLGCDR
ncbi:peptide chain release factor N(5)-glutamine methyltransferase [candidate division GN15 bacterium]|nr:peptide chain release factor N(5)-glutamine methyltransferase [candidate division GN15 bacterium]